jgi:hypothetical protein
MDICRQLLLQYEREGDELLCSIVIGDQSWMHHFELKMKTVNGMPSQRFAGKKKFKTAPSAGKVKLTAFWEVDGPVHSDFMPTGATFNSDRYVGMLQRLKACIRTVRPGM